MFVMERECEPTDRQTWVMTNTCSLSPVLSDSHRPSSLSQSFTQDCKQSSFSNCNFENVFIPSLLPIYYFFFLKDVKLQWIEEFWESCFAYWYEIVKCLKYRYMIVKCLKETAMKLGKRGVQSFIHNRLGLMYM